jgi:Cd2+/Zn2+-exporting ATPase
MDCPGCATTVTRGLLGIEGVREVHPDIVGQKVRVTFDPDSADPELIRSSLHRLGYGIAPPPPEPASEDKQSGTDGPGWIALLREAPPHVKLGGMFWGLTILATLLGDSEAMVALLALASVGTAGWSIFPRAWAAARRGVLDMHVLMAVAALGALGIAEYVEAGAVLFLFAIARTLEQRTLERARTEVRSLMDLAPVEATVLRHGHQVTVPVEAVRVGETVLVRPGERIPVDGTIVGGASEIDASAVTGEATPEGKFVGDKVFAGSVNGSGALEIRCDLPASDSALRSILRSIEEARARKSATEAFVDRFARIYTPLVMAVALGVAILPPLLGGGLWADWGYRALVLVVIACPCALVISTPITVVSALTGAARRGILIKSGVHLETMGKVRVVALDKTGTLTEGVSEVAGLLPWRGTAEADLLRMAAAAESRSEHPIGRAIMAEVQRRGLLPPEGVEMTALPGRGVRARYGSSSILLGSPRLFREEGLLDAAHEAQIAERGDQGGTLVLVGWSDSPTEPIELRGALLLMDRVRPEGARLIAELREAGVKRLVLMSGDRTASVEAAANEAARGGAHFDEWKGELLPAEKVEWIRELRSRYGPVLMVGDGVNDAPALAAADVGMAMGNRGTAAALDTADIALMEDNLARIPSAFRIGRKAAAIIRANVAFALAVKVVFVLLGGTGHATLWMAVIADMGSSLVVILNGLRTLRE